MCAAEGMLRDVPGGGTKAKRLLANQCESTSRCCCAASSPFHRQPHPKLSAVAGWGRCVLIARG